MTIKTITPTPETSQPLWQIWRLFPQLWAERNLIRQMSRRQLQALYRGSYLGVLWSLLTPLAMLGVYTFVFAIVFQSRWGTERTGGNAEFALILFAGLMAFNVFADVVSAAPNLILSHTNFVKRVVFPIEILPVTQTIVAVVQSFWQVGILLVGAWLFLGTFSKTLFLLPLAYVPLVFLSLGVGWFLASLGVFVRDTDHFVRIGVQMLFFLTPVFYPLEIVPAFFQSILKLNPLTYILTLFRQVVLFGEMPAFSSYLLATATTYLIAWLGYSWFMKTKTSFADVL
jgi:lipopolysaccharide transport system permease protein